MAVQLPEPDYYTLAEVAERWGKSEDFLLRLGAEEKLVFAWPVLSSGMTIGNDFAEDGPPSTVEEVERLFPSLRPGQLCVRVIPADEVRDRTLREDSLADGPSQEFIDLLHQTYPVQNWRDEIQIVMGGLAYLCSFCLAFDVHNGVISHPSFSRVSHFINNEKGEHYMEIMGGLPPLPAPYYFCAYCPVHKSELVVPTSEIHRIEHQQEAAEKAAADDVLRGSAIASRRIMLTVINALCGKAGIDPRGRNATTEIVRLLDAQGTPAAERTVRDAIKQIPDAMKTRKTEQ